LSPEIPSELIRRWPSESYGSSLSCAWVLQALEQWLRRRLRSMAWKQWKRGRTRYRELRKRDVGKELAAKTAGSSHGPRRIAMSPALSFAFPNAHFVKIGLPPMVVRRNA
jgi:RNA-directed DNA polymerase